MKTRTLIVVLLCFLTSVNIADVLTEAQELSATPSTLPSDEDVQPAGTEADPMATDKPCNCPEGGHRPDVDPEDDHPDGGCDGAHHPDVDPEVDHPGVYPEGDHPDVACDGAHHPHVHPGGDHPGGDYDGAHHPHVHPGGDHPGGDYDGAHHPHVHPGGDHPGGDYDGAHHPHVHPGGDHPGGDYDGAHHPHVHPGGDHPDGGCDGTHHLEAPSFSEAEWLATMNELKKQQRRSDGGEQLPEPCAGASSPETMQLLGKAITDFGMEMFREVLNGTKKPNVIISPLSVVLGLAQLSLGSANETERDLEAVLHWGSLGCPHYTMRTAINTFSQRVLAIASTIYVRHGFHVKSGFLNDSKSFYQSRPQPLSGDSADDTRRINAWVEEKTGGKIRNFLNRVPGDVVLMLVNAINFKGRWQVQFDPKATGSEPFYLEDGRMEHVAMMQHHKYPTSVSRDDELQSEIVRIAFQNNMSFIVVKPMLSSNLNAVANKLKISAILGHPKPLPLLLKMPKLNIDFATDLRESLQSLGLGSIFQKPDLSRMAGQPLAVSAVQHKATMELTEEGVEAAASTAISINRSHMQYALNSPFFFLIRHDPSGIPLFMGTVKDPQPQLPKSKRDKLRPIPDFLLEEQVAPK
ncbi:serpin peptidase inhibitor, clade F (alpha-2 antiplasmin, pigment epithelium derived factor), member 2b isoform X2 [Leucoraja erinacea]|nr:serpin peptidase inhibitor, clade F (alpha-2 antiplasmin, pigment epithelium derived factor), member 2b isoform X2 [Leucoraja erinacea]